MRRKAFRWRSSSALTLAFTSFGLVLGTAAACVELPPTEPAAMDEAAGYAWGGEDSTGDDTSTGGTSSGGASSGGTSSGGTATGGDGTGGSATGGGNNGGTNAAGSGATGAAGDGGSTAGGGGRGGTGQGGSSAGKGGTSSGGKGGGGGKGGTGGAGTAGAGGFSTNRDEFFGSSRCTSSFALCDDFERTTLDTARWRVQGPAPTIDSMRAARGMRSAHFHTTDNGLSLLHATSIFPATNNTYWGRMFVWFDTMPTAPMWAHWSIVGAVGSGNETEVRLGGQYDGSKNRFGVGTDHGPTGDWTNLDEDPGDPVPVDSWICVEWLHKGDTNETRFYWDGVEHPSLHTTATDHGGPQSQQYVLPTFEDVFVGWWLYQPGTTPGQFDVWIDEVALDDARIGCSL